MKTDFSPRFFRGVGEPGGFGGTVASLAGGTPWGAIAQAGIGLVQGIGGFIQSRKAQRRLEQIKSPTYSQNESILDFYNKALQRYNVNPYSSAAYRMQKQNAAEGLTTGISTLQDRRSVLSGLPALVKGYNDASLKAVAAAEEDSNQKFNQLGTATNLKASEDRTAFDINKMQPFMRKYNLLAAKAGGGAQVMNAGLSNIYGGAQSATDYEMLKKIYG